MTPADAAISTNTSPRWQRSKERELLTMNHRMFLILGLVALPLVGCASEPQKPPATSDKANDSAGQASRSGADKNPEKRADINISEEIRKACGLTQAEAFFAYDSSRLRASDQPVFQKLATCFTSGPLAGRKMLLVGRADPRGEEEYNLVLGDSRAQSVQRALVSLKMRQEQIQTSSRGEMDAEGASEEGWARDRRVDVLLASSR